MQPIEGAFYGAPMPYVRSTRKTRFAGRDAERVRAYERDKARTAAFVLDEIAKMPDMLRRFVARDFPIVATPYRIGAVAIVEPTKKGLLPDGGKGSGDHDNLTKAFIDALVGAGIVKNDSPRWYLGPTPINGQNSGIYVGDESAFFWRIEPSTPVEFNAHIEPRRHATAASILSASRRQRR